MPRVAEMRCHLRDAHADRQQVGPRTLEFLVMVTQLRDVIATEGSAVVTQPDDDRRPVRPELAHSSLHPVGVGERDVFDCREISHATDSSRAADRRGSIDECG